MLNLARGSGLIYTILYVETVAIAILGMFGINMSKDIVFGTSFGGTFSIIRECLKVSV